MRILIITETLHAGGAETFTLRLCRKLKELGHVTEILNLNPDIENATLLKQYSDITITRVQLPFLKLIKKIDSLLFRLKIDFSLQHHLIQAWIEKNIVGKYQIYHTHLIKVDYLFSLIKLHNPELKVISTVHGDYTDYYYKIEAGKKLRWLNFNRKLSTIQQQINKWIVIAQEQQLFFQNRLQVPSAKISKIYNGFEAKLTYLSSKAPGKFIIGMVARGVKLKGWSLLLQAFTQMPEDCELRLIGTGEYLDGIKDRYQDNPRIKFLGFHPNPIEEIINFDVFVLPSLFPHEALPTVVMEALYCGKPVIATNVGEIPYMLTEPDSKLRAGFLLDFDGKSIDPNQITSYLLMYYHNPQLVKQHGELAIKAFLKFDMDACARLYLEAYESIIQ